MARQVIHHWTNGQPYFVIHEGLAQAACVAHASRTCWGTLRQALPCRERSWAAEAAARAKASKAKVR